ncbi:MAG TPA: hypothetical protein VM118_08385 [Acidobacteriota bacterium]|nr:hypothetical protein [Acidobacteriota bacterium]
MTGRFLRICATLCLAGAIGGGSVWAIDSPETLRKFELRRKMARRGVLDRWQEYKQLRDYRNIPLQDAYQARPLRAFNPSVVDDIATGASLLTVLDVDTIPSPGVAIGITSYDSQANASIGREVASNPGSETVHFCWTMWDIIPTALDQSNRFVNYNSWDKPSGSTNQGFNGTSVSLGDFARAGFCRQDVDAENLCNIAMHQRIELDFPYSTWHLNFTIEGSDQHTDTELLKPGQFPDETEMLWPDIAVEQNGIGDASNDIYHIVCTGGVDAGGGYASPSDRIWYYRYDNGTPLPAWEGPVLLDSSRNISWTMDADDNSNHVCVTYTSDYYTDEMNGLNNIAYRESQTSGAGWISGVELDGVNKNFATSYSDVTGPQAWIETSVAYDHAGDLHILYTEQRASGSEHLALKHWRKSRVGPPRTVQIAYYDNDGTWGRVLNLGSISLGVGDGATSCKGGGETNEDYLYACFIKLGGETSAEAQDMSQLGYANGELWVTASNNHGDTWASAANLSNTKFPECTSRHADSVCTSEAWSSMARDVSDIEIFFIYDFETGAYDEAPWTMNRAMYLNIPGGTQDADYVCPILTPNFDAYMSYVPECEYHADAGGVNMETLTVLNLGNDDLEGNISVTAGNSWLSITPADIGDYTILAGDPDIVTDVTMSAVGLSEDLYIGEIKVWHNDTSKVSPRVFPIEFFVVTDFKCPQGEILRTAVGSPGVLSLEVGSNSRFASQNDEGGLWRYLDSSSMIFDATLLVAYGDQPTETGDTIVFHRFMDGNDPGQGGLRAVTDLVIDTSSYGTGNGYAKASSEIHTHAEGLSPDSAIAIKVKWYFPQNPLYGDFVIAKYTVWNRTASPLSDVTVAVWGDLDVVEAAHLDELQQGVDNHGYYDADWNLLYQYGYDTIGHLPSDVFATSERYSGGLTYISGRDAQHNEFKATSVLIRGAVEDNRVNDEGGGPSSGLLYRSIVGPSGVTVFEPAAHRDSSKDLFTFLTLDQGFLLQPGEEIDYVIGLVSDTLNHPAFPGEASGTTSLIETVEKAWQWAEDNVLCNCSCHADHQCDGVTNVLDVVWTVNVAFRGSAAVFDDDCPYERTDVDCSSVTDIRDVVLIIDVAFRGGLPSSSFCDGCQDPQVVTCSPTVPEPGNSVIVESKQVSPGATGVTVGVFVENDIELAGLEVPLELRAAMPGSYITTSFTFNVQGRVGSSGLTDFPTKRILGIPAANTCSGPVSNSYALNNAVDYVSPDGVLWAGVLTGSPYMAPGSDGVPGVGTPSFLFTFDVTSVDGFFEIDTCCVAPGNHILFVEGGTNNCIVPTFTKGTITVGQCPPPGATLPPVADWSVGQEYGRAGAVACGCPDCLYHAGVDIRKKVTAIWGSPLWAQQTYKDQRATEVTAAQRGMIKKVFGLNDRPDDNLRVWNPLTQEYGWVPAPTGGSNHGLGICVILEHSTEQGTYYTLYGHLDAVNSEMVDRLATPLSDVVCQGEFIGFIGNSSGSLLRRCDDDGHDHATLCQQDLSPEDISLAPSPTTTGFPPHVHWEEKQFGVLGDTDDDACFWGYTSNYPDQHFRSDPMRSVHTPTPIPGGERQVWVTDAGLLAGARLRGGPGNYPIVMRADNSIELIAFEEVGGTVDPGCQMGWYRLRRLDGLDFDHADDGTIRYAWMCVGTSGETWLGEEPQSLEFTGLSPVSLIVTSPSGDSIGPDFNTLGSAASYDGITDQNGDGDPDDRISIQLPDPGEYQVRVFSKPDASPGDTYSLEVHYTGMGQTFLVEDQPVPPEGSADEIIYSHCACPCHGDPQCDGATDVLDVVNAVNVAFRGAAATTDPLCPYEQTDVSCDGVTNVIDVVKFVNVAFRGGDPDEQFCHPCAP